MAKDYELLIAARFYLELKLKGSDDRIDGYFMECQGFKRQQEMIEHCEVVHQKWGSKSAEKGRVVRTKMPGNAKSNNITLKMGMTLSSTTWKWFKSVEEGNWSEQLRDGSLTLYRQDGEMAARFDFLGAWPVSYEIGDVKADGNDFQVEKVELAVDEFKRVDKDGSDFTV